MLGGMISRGKADARKLAHARVLLHADASEGGPEWTDTRIAEAVRVSVRTIERVRQRFVEDGLEAALLPKPSPRGYARKLDGARGAEFVERGLEAPRRPNPPARVYARKLDGAQEAKLMALACSGPPEGKKRWTLRLLAERMVELEIVSELSHETVRQTLKKECAQTAPAADVVHPAQALGRVRSTWKTCWRSTTARMTRSGRWSAWTSAASS